jgi:hypothetical protein
METVQIRVPKKILEKVDEIIKLGYFQSRSEVMRDALREFILHGNFFTSVPHMVGPFTARQIELLKNATVNSVQVSDSVVQSLKKELIDFRFD